MEMIKFFKRDRNTTGDRFDRNLSLDVSRANKEQSSIPVVISTETPIVTKRGVKQVLDHSEGAVKMDRVLQRGMAITVKHGGEIVGRVRNVALAAKRLVGDMFFSRSEEGQRYFQDVMDGIITDVSVDGGIFKRKMIDGIERVLLWEPANCALVGTGADPNSGIISRDGDGDGDGDEAAKEKRLLERGRASELNRQTSIRDVFERHLNLEGVEALQGQCITDGETLERSRELLLNALGTINKPVSKTPASTFVTGEDERDKFSLGINRALSIRVGVATEEDMKDMSLNPYTSYNPVEMARAYLTMWGHNIVGLSRSQIVGDSFVRGAILGGATTSDFPNILADVANKAMLKGYNETPETWQVWCHVGNLTDFKEALRVNLSEFDNLPEVPEAGEYSHGKFSDLAEKIRLLTYGKLFTISRQALINDDLSALGRIPMGMGRAAARRVGDLAYGTLTDNPIMNQDGIVLFHADHNNIGTPGELPTVETMDAARVQMGLQTGPADKATLGIVPAYGICSLEVQGTFTTLMKAQYDPAAPASNLVPNFVQGLVQVVPEHRLSRDDPEGWYLAASPGVNDTIEVAFLDGNQNPYLEQQEGFTRDGVSHKVRIDAAAAPMDFRGLWYNGGASS